MGEILSGHHILFSHSILETHKSAFTLTQKLKKVEFFFRKGKNRRLFYAGGLRQFLRLERFGE